MVRTDIQQIRDGERLRLNIYADSEEENAIIQKFLELVDEIGVSVTRLVTFTSRKAMSVETGQEWH